MFVFEEVDEHSTNDAKEGSDIGVERSTHCAE